LKSFCALARIFSRTCSRCSRGYGIESSPWRGAYSTARNMFANISTYVLEHIFSRANPSNAVARDHGECRVNDMTKKSDAARVKGNRKTRDIAGVGASR